MIELLGHLYAPDERGFCAVTVEGGSIVRIESWAGDRADADGAAEPQPTVIGGRGARILPGLVDIQLNGAFGADFSDPDADLATVCARLPELGVTAFAPAIVSSPPDAYEPALANLRRSPRPGEARVLGVHIEGPFISSRYAGTHARECLRLPSIAEAAAWLEAGDLRWLTLAPELPGALELTRYLAERGVRVSLGHTDASWAEAKAAVEAGATLATHLFNAMRPFHHRDPGVAGYVLASGVRAGVIGDGVHLAFETLRMLVRIKAPDELFLVTDGLAGLGMPPGRYSIAGQDYVSDGTVGRRLDGTLSGSLLPLNLAIRNLVRDAGFAPAVAVRLATLNPARALGLEASIGLVEVGRPADLTIVDEDWQVLATVCGGSVAYLAERDADR